MTISTLRFAFLTLSRARDRHAEPAMTAIPKQSILFFWCFLVSHCPSGYRKD